MTIFKSNNHSLESRAKLIAHRSLEFKKNIASKILEILEVDIMTKKVLNNMVNRKSLFFQIQCQMMR